VIDSGYLHRVLDTRLRLTTLMMQDLQYRCVRFPTRQQLFFAEAHQDLPNLFQLCDAIYPSELP
jgi:hypothetical protein